MLPFHAFSVPTLTLANAQGFQKRLVFSTVEPLAAHSAYNATLHQPPNPLGSYNVHHPIGFLLTTSYTALSATKGRIQGESFEFVANQPVGAFQYLILYLLDPITQSSPILGYWKFPAPVSLAAGDRIRFSFNNKQLGEICDITISSSSPPPPSIETFYAALLQSVPRRIYVAPAGSDNNGGTAQAPVRTITRAVDMAPAAEKTAILLGEGTYALSFNGIGMGGGYIADNGKPILFLAYPKTVTVTHASPSAREVHALHLTHANSAIYGIISRLLPRADQVENYAVSCFGSQGSSPHGRGAAYNCVFTSASRMSIHYSDVNTTTACHHCTFTAPNPMGNYNSGAVQFHNCVYKPGLVLPNAVNCISREPDVNANYIIPGAENTTHGVWSGTYKWV